MSIVWAGGEVGDFVNVGSATAATNTTAAIRDANYTRAAIAITGTAGSAAGSSYLQALTPSHAEYVRFAFYASTATGTANSPIILLRTLTDNVCRLVHTGTSGVLQFQRWDGSAWQNVGTTFTYTLTTLYQFCLRAKIDASGRIEFWNGSTLHASYDGNTSALGDVREIRFGGYINSTQIMYISEIIAASHDVRAARLKTLNLTGAGTNSEWSGAVGDINSDTPADSSFISSATAGQKSSYSAADLYADSLLVEAIVVSGKMRKNDTGPTSIDALIRSAGTDYFQSFGTLTTTLALKQSIFANDPATGVAWTRTAASAAEIGVRSVA